MADDSPVGLALAEAPKKRLRKRRMKIDADVVARHVLDAVKTEQDNRAELMTARTVRYAKLRGWREQPDDSWGANQHLPVMMANSLRVKAGLFNAMLGIRPPMMPKVLRRDLKERAETANALVDYQLFVENQGEKFIEQYIDAFVDDGTVVSYQQWTKDRRLLHDVRVIPQPPADQPLVAYLADRLPVLVPSLVDLAVEDDDGYRWTGAFVNDEEDRTDVTITVWDKDEDKLELVLEWDALAFNGPTAIVHDLEDIVVPLRCENTQPVRPQNPTGAPWVARLIRVDLDTVKRRMEDGTYDLLTDDDWDRLTGAADLREKMEDTSGEETGLRDLKDSLEGRESRWAGDEAAREWVTVVEWYGGWDVNKDGLKEDVIFTVIKEIETLVRAKFLTEIHPGLPIRRPFSDTRYVPVKGQFYGIGLPELMEGLHDFLHVILNQSLDAGTIANQPFFFYRASSGLKPEIIRLWPGEGYPLDNPGADVSFPALPQRDQSWAMNMIGLGMQFMQQLTQIGPMQMGQVPTGKASALRTLGTTMAILQQGAAMPEQILRRLFMGFQQMWEQFHQLNTRFLPKKKAFLIAGKGLDTPEAYGVIEDPAQIEIPIAFDFQATLLNTNKGLKQQALMAIGSATINPLTMQLGIVDPETIYNWAKDTIQAAELDPARYIKKPQGAPPEGAQRLSALEVIAELTGGTLPEYAPLEDPETHYATLLKFAQSPEFGFLRGGTEQLFKAYLQKAVAGMRQAAQRQQMRAAAEQFATMLGNQGQGQGSQPGMGAEPPMQAEMASQPEVMGAMTGGA